jgi:signal transduction histidine kinase
MLEEDATHRGDAPLAADLQKIREAGGHLLNLVNNVLDLSKIEATKMDVFLETFDAQRLIDEVSAALRPMLIRNKNALEISRPGGPVAMHSDATKVRQVLYNLLSNAAKFTHEGTIRLRLEERDEGGGPGVRIAVEDTGIGISPEQQGRLFQSFTQADASTARKYGGTGLGLALTKRFVEMLGGSIALSSEPGVGTVFTVDLPRALAPAPASSAAKPLEAGGEGEASIAEAPSDVGALQGLVEGEDLAGEGGLDADRGVARPR